MAIETRAAALAAPAMLLQIPGPTILPAASCAPGRGCTVAPAGAAATPSARTA